MDVNVRDIPLTEADADLVAIGLFDGDDLPSDLAGAPGAPDARGGFKKVALLLPESPGRVLAVGLGKQEDFNHERARVAAAIAAKRAASLEATSIAWALPEGAEAEIAVAIVEGTILAGYKFDRFLSSDSDEPKPRVERLTILGAESLADSVTAARITAEAENRARDLQNLPSNIATPTFLAERAEEIGAAHDAVEVEIMGREEITAAKMGGLVAVSIGSDEDPRLIVLRYAKGGDGPTLGLVGKAVTFDTGGISLKPSGGMHEMKMDMSGGAAVLETVSAIAELGLPINLIAVIPSTENMPSGHATKPGDIITQLNGKTVEVNNTDAEGRLILADALTHCARLGADRMINLATLTGAVLVALGSTYAALISNDDDLAGEVAAAGDATGELVWRLPLHPEYKDLTKGTVADLTNAAAKRKAGTIYAGSFLEEFVEDKPWVHLDIAGTSWDVGREYVGKGATGYGVRLLVELARNQSAA